MNSKTASALLKLKEELDSVGTKFNGLTWQRIDNTMQEYASQQTEALTDQIKDLERENAEYRAVYDSVVKSRDELRQENERLREESERWKNKTKMYQKYHKEMNFAMNQNKVLRDGIKEALKFLNSRSKTTPGLGAPVTILKIALEEAQ